MQHEIIMEHCCLEIFPEGEATSLVQFAQLVDRLVILIQGYVSPRGRRGMCKYCGETQLIRKNENFDFKIIPVFVFSWEYF